MIIEYNRPDTLAEALKLLERSEPITVPLGGGTLLNAPSDEEVAVVDLQNLGLGTVRAIGSNLTIGAAATLQSLLDSQKLPDALSKAIQHEAAYNLRQMASAAGALVAADGRSPFATAMLALEAKLTWLPGDESQSLGEYLPLRPKSGKGSLISEITIPTNIDLAYEYVARSPADLPIVCVAAARWKSGRTRVALGGYGAAPVMVVDGKDENDILPGVENAYSEAGDEWASAEYRGDVVQTLTQRCLDQLNEKD